MASIYTKQVIISGSDTYEMDFETGLEQALTNRGNVMSAAERILSQVKWFNEKKGFGFIINPEGDHSDDIFVHYKDIRGEGYKTLDQDAHVSFVLEKGPKGYKALDVTTEERAF